MSRHTDGDFSVFHRCWTCSAQTLFTTRRQKRGFFFVPVVVNVPRTKVQCVEIFSEYHTEDTLCSAAGCSAVELRRNFPFAFAR